MPFPFMHVQGVVKLKAPDVKMWLLISKNSGNGGMPEVRL